MLPLLRAGEKARYPPGRHERGPAWAGGFLGAAVTVRWTHAVFLPLAALWTLYTLGTRQALRLALASAPFLGALGLLDAWMFGVPWVTPYDRVGLGLLSGAPHRESSHWQHFDLPFWAGLRNQIFDAQKGLLASAPLLLLALPGLAVLWRRVPREALLIAGFALAQVALFATYREWNASSFGHRFLLTAIALGCPAVAACLSHLLGERSSDQA